LRAPPPSEELTCFALAFWRQQLEDAEMSAVLTELPWTHERNEPFQWRDSQGERYDVLLLYNAHALTAHVGLALLHIAKGSVKPRWSTAWLSTLALQLSEAVNETHAL
jgi:hypothetical protein